MNSEAASETQYKDSKPHFTKYRKDAKIMLRRKLLSVLLALALVVSMAVPALAVSGTWEGIDYRLTASYSVSSGTASFWCEAGAPTVWARPTVNILPEDINVTGAESENQNTVGSTATTSVSNRAYSELYGIYVYGEIVSIYAKGFIGSNFAAYGYF